MKQKIIISVLVVIGLSISITSTHAQGINGWWIARMTIDQGNFIYGDWLRIYSQGKKSSYLYIRSASESFFSGKADVALWDEEGGNYIKESYTVYIRNNIVVFIIPTTVDAAGNFLSGATMVLRAYGSPNVITFMKGYYTLYDIENAGTPEEFVRMGTVSMNRPLSLRLIPKDVADLVGP